MLKRFLLVCTTAASVLASQPVYAQSTAKDFEPVPIQHNGRIKAFGSFSGQVVELVTGKTSWQKKPAVQVLLELLADEEKALDTAWIRCDYPPLKNLLGLTDEAHHYSFNALVAYDQKIEELVSQAQSKRDADQRPSKMEQEAESLFNRMMTAKHVINGDFIRVVPHKNSSDWSSAYKTLDGGGAPFRELVRLHHAGDIDNFKSKTAQWIERVHETTGGAYRDKLSYEIQYLNLKPFHWAWIIYLAAFFLLVYSKAGSPFKTAGILAVIVGFGFHTAGLVLRVLVLGRPPVSNMYESMVYMNWALMIFAFIFYFFGRQNTLLSAGSLISALVMIYGDILPVDSNLEVLVPVLRSNYWLTVHVMTIVASYGAFGLAMALAHRHLVLAVFDKHFSGKAQEDSCQLMYRVIQLGVLLVGIGTVLGGVWANESWGRFWGWDPKETWALITFLGYLIIVHLRFKRWINPFWTAVSSILGFQLVLMTWYGVNFVLGRGLHSYGQGAGGMFWVSIYLAAETAFLVWVIFLHSAVKPKKTWRDFLPFRF